jgi:DNA-binding LacI/PurR family transcriptional regulator
MEMIYQRGLRIPEDIAITGYDDIPLAADLAVPLTTVRTSFYRFGHSAALNLVKLIRDPAFNTVQVLVPYKLIVRAST